MSAVTVFAHSLCYFKERFIQEIQDQSTTGVVETAIRWVITVPAIWSPSAKQFVRLAAFEVCIYANVELCPDTHAYTCTHMRTHARTLTRYRDACRSEALGPISGTPHTPKCGCALAIN